MVPERCSAVMIAEEMYVASASLKRSWSQIWRSPSGAAVLGFVVVGLLLLFFPWLSGNRELRSTEVDKRMVQEGEAAVHSFHAAVSQQQYDEVCRFAEPKAFFAISEVPCSEFLAFVRSQLGTIVDSRRVRAASVLDRYGYVVGVQLDYETRYQQRKASEQFEWSIEGSKKSLRRYHVNWGAAAR
jgi:hypothetical protein